MENDSPEKSAHPPTKAASLRGTWKGYLFEFFMLFFAVFLGFFVENQRENYSEKQQELQFIRSMIDDLRKDTAFFNALAIEKKKVAENYDSLVDLFSVSKRTLRQQQRLYVLARTMPFSINYLQINDRTYEQMKGSGNLRLIENELISHQISEYYFNSKEIRNNTDETVIRIERMLELQGNLFDATVFRDIVDMRSFAFRTPKTYPKLVTEDKRDVNNYLMSLHYVVSISSFSGKYLKRLKSEAEQLIIALQLEYNL
ncbi:MAG TPA: hypothetical protein VL728_10555 [Cyclobacteriaceae bacterium]|jgi:hypothetical protein|nr:hypothetical protein [Cyclobacteriaceae bacterium]